MVHQGLPLIKSVGKPTSTDDMVLMAILQYLPKDNHIRTSVQMLPMFLYMRNLTWSFISSESYETVAAVT